MNYSNHCLWQTVEYYRTEMVKSVRLQQRCSAHTARTRGCRDSRISRIGSSLEFCHGLAFSSPQVGNWLIDLSAKYTTLTCEWKILTQFSKYFRYTFRIKALQNRAPWCEVFQANEGHLWSRCDCLTLFHTNVALCARNQGCVWTKSEIS